VESVVVSIAREWFVRLPNDWLKSVFYVCVGDHEGPVRAVGTGFLVAVNLTDDPDLGGAVYAVTARHVVEHAAEYPRTALRLNTKTGSWTLVDCTASRWVCPDDQAIDVAVAPFTPNLDVLDCKWIPRSMFADRHVIEREEIGIGDDLAMIGLFAMHEGVQQNQPIVRVGNIAAMPVEPLTDERTGSEFRAILAEIRSIGGLSGSPVFAVTEPTTVGMRSIGLQRKYFLIGLVRGHWDIHRQPIEYLARESESVNLGIGLVTPVADLVAVIDGEELVAQRRKLARDLVTGRAKTPGSQS
jgi:hypothetical protein